MKKEDLIEVVSRWTKAELYKRVGDGHTIWAPSALVSWGFSEEWVEKITKKHTSGIDFMEKLYNEKGPVDYIVGVYGGLFADKLAHGIGANTDNAYQYFGRGKTAQAIAEAVEKVVRKFDQTDSKADKILQKNSSKYLDLAGSRAVG